MKNKRNLTIKNAWICQVRQESIEPVFGDLIISDGKITSIQPSDFKEFLRQYPDDKDDAANANGRIVTVPLINFHDHFYSRLAKGLPIRGEMDDFQHILKNLWWNLDRALDLDMVYASAVMGVLESIRQGVTYIFDHHASPDAIKDSLATIKKVLDRFGVRGVLCFEVSDRNGAEFAREALDEFANFTEQQVNNDIKSMLGLHAAFTLEDESLQQAGELIQKYDAGIHIHLCEDESDRNLCIEKYELIPVHRLIKFDLLNYKSILAHGIHLCGEDYYHISNSGSAIAYNPDSNLNNAVGLPEFKKVPENIPILMGTDGMHANMSRTMKQLFLLFRHQKNSFDAAFEWIQKIYFEQFKFVKQYFPDFPQLSIGDRADLIVWDYIPPTPVSAENFWGHFIYGILEYPVHSVMQNGRFLMENKVIEGEDEIRKKIYSQRERLVAKLLNT